MRQLVRVALAAFIALALGACASAPKVAMTPDAKRSLKRIAVIETPEPDTYIMLPGQLPGGFALYMFGAIGGAVLGGIETSRMESASKSLTDAVRPYKPDISATFRNQLMDRLKGKGYEVVVLPPPPKDAEGKQYDLTKLDGTYDAYLIGTIGGGYSMESGRAAPRLMGSVSLVGKAGQPTYFAQTYLYAARKTGDAFWMAPEPRFVLGSSEDLYRNGQLAAEALKAGASRIATEVALQF